MIKMVSEITEVKVNFLMNCAKAPGSHLEKDGIIPQAHNKQKNKLQMYSESKYKK